MLLKRLELGHLASMRIRAYHIASVVALCQLVAAVAAASTVYTSSDAVAAVGYATLVNHTTPALVKGNLSVVASEVSGELLVSADVGTIPFAKPFSANFYTATPSCALQRTPALINARQALSLAENSLIDSANGINSSAVFLLFICQATGASAFDGGEVYVSYSETFGHTWVDPVLVPGTLATSAPMLLAAPAVLPVGPQTWVVPAFLVTKSSAGSVCLARIAIQRPNIAANDFTLSASIVPIASAEGEGMCQGDAAVSPSWAVSAAAAVAANGAYELITQVKNATGSTVLVRSITCPLLTSPKCEVVSEGAPSFFTESSTQLPGVLVSATVFGSVFNSTQTPAFEASLVAVHDGAKESVDTYTSTSNVSVLLGSASRRVLSRNPTSVLPAGMNPSAFYVSVTGMGVAFLPSLPPAAFSGIGDSSAEVGTAVIAFSSYYVSHTNATDQGRVPTAVATFPVVTSYPAPQTHEDKGEPTLSATITFALLGAVSAALIGYHILGRMRYVPEPPEHHEEHPDHEPVDHERAPLVRESGKIVAEQPHVAYDHQDIHSPKEGGEVHVVKRQISINGHE